MNGRDLTLGTLAGLAVAGLIVQQRGSANDTSLSPLQKRLLYLIDQYPEPTASYTLVFAGALPGVRAGRKLEGRRRTLQTEWEESYLSSPKGRAKMEDDIRRLGIEPKAWAKGIVKDGMWYDGSTLVPRSGWEPLLPWIGKEINRIVRTLPPVQRIPVSTITFEGRGFLTLDLDKIRRLHAFDADTRMEFAENGWADTRRMNQDLYGNGRDSDTAKKAATRQKNRYIGNRIEDIFGPTSNVHSHHNGGMRIGFRFAYTDEDLPTPEQILIQFHLKRFYDLLPEIRDWFGSGIAGDMGKFTYEDAAKKAKAWHRQIEQAAGATKGAKKSSTEGTVVARLSDGWTIQELDAGDLRPQSDALNHCVGRSDTYRNMIQNGTGKIFSVRDGAGRSIFTLEIRTDGLDDPEAYDPRVVQFKGQGNRIPGLTAAKTKKAPYGVEVMKEWIKRARKPFVSMTDVERVVEVVLALQGLFWKNEKNLKVWIIFPTRDLDVVRAVGKMPPDVRSYGR